MAAQDNLAAGFTGVASGVSDYLGKYINYKLARRAKREDNEDELANYQAKLPLQLAAQTKQKEIDAKFDRENKLAEIQAQEESTKRVNAAKPRTTYVQMPDGSVTEYDGKFSRAPVAPADKKKAEAEAKVDATFPKALGSYQNAVKGYENLITQAEALLRDPDLTYATGLVGAKNNVTSSGRRIGSNLETIKSKTLLNTLSSLKELSSTGASGFGALSNTEGDVLKNSIVSLNRSLATPDFKDNLRAFISDVKASKNIVASTFQRTYAKQLEADPNALAQTAGLTEPTGATPTALAAQAQGAPAPVRGQRRPLSDFMR